MFVLTFWFDEGGSFFEEGRLDVGTVLFKLFSCILFNLSYTIGYSKCSVSFPFLIGAMS